MTPAYDLPAPPTDGRRWIQTLRSILQRLDRIESTSDVPTGAMLWWPGLVSQVPAGFAAGGAVLPRARYEGLFARIGTTGGEGDGSTTFVVPASPAGVTPPAGPVGCWIVRA